MQRLGIENPVAAARAIEKRLTEMERAHCLRSSLDSIEQPGFESDRLLGLDGIGIRTSRKLPDVLTVDQGLEGIVEPWVGLYRMERSGSRPRARLLTLITGSGLPDPGSLGVNALNLVKTAAFQVPGAKEPLLVVMNTYFWPSSCWHPMRVAVFAPGPAPLSPRELEKTILHDGYDCDPPDIDFDGSELTIRYSGAAGWDESGRARTIGLIPVDSVFRPATLAFAVDSSLHFKRRFGYVAGKDGVPCLIEDWLQDDWELAAQASSSASLAELERAHRRFGSRTPDAHSHYSMELFSRRGGLRAAVYCDRGKKTKPCSEWPEPVDFMLKREGQRWQIAAVKERDFKNGTLVLAGFRSAPRRQRNVALVGRTPCADAKALRRRGSETPGWRLARASGDRCCSARADRVGGAVRAASRTDACPRRAAPEATHARRGRSR